MDKKDKKQISERKKECRSLVRTATFSAALGVVVFTIFCLWPLTIVWLIGLAVATIVVNIHWGVNELLALFGYAAVSVLLPAFILYFGISRGWIKGLPERMRGRL